MDMHLIRDCKLQQYEIETGTKTEFLVCTNFATREDVLV